LLAPPPVNVSEATPLAVPPQPALKSFRTNESRSALPHLIDKHSPSGDSPTKTPSVVVSVDEVSDECSDLESSVYGRISKRVASLTLTDEERAILHHALAVAGEDTEGTPYDDGDIEPPDTCENENDQPNTVDDGMEVEVLQEPTQEQATKKRKHRQSISSTAIRKRPKRHSITDTPFNVHGST